MGDNFLKRQTANFQKGRDQAAVEYSRPTLFDRPEVSSTVYTVLPIENCEFKDGETLLVVASDDRQSAVLARGHIKVGMIDGDGAKSLLDAIEASPSGLAELHITEVSGLSGLAKAMFVTE